MTELTIETSRDQTKALVKLALDNTPNIVSYDEEDDTIVAHAGGTATSFGEEIIVQFPGEPAKGDEGATDDEHTTIDVTAHRSKSFNMTANPWKRKSDFLEELRRLREFGRNGSFEHVLEQASADEGAEDGAADEDESGAEADAASEEPGEIDESDVLLLAAKVMFIMLVCIFAVGTTVLFAMGLI